MACGALILGAIERTEASVIRNIHAGKFRGAENGDMRVSWIRGGQY